MAIVVKLEVFEGPLDLLLHLIEKNKVDIFDINIPKIRKSIINPVVAQKKFKPKLVREFDNHHIYDLNSNDKHFDYQLIIHQFALLMLHH